MSNRIKLRKIQTAHRGEITFRIHAWKGDGKFAFAEELLFFQEELTQDASLLSDIAEVLIDLECVSHGHRNKWGAEFKDKHLEALRALPGCLLDEVSLDNIRRADSLIAIVRSLVRVVWSEFHSVGFWRREGMNRLILRRKEIEEIEAKLAELVPKLENGPSWEFWTAHRRANETLRFMRRPIFTKFSHALPRNSETSSPVQQ